MDRRSFGRKNAIVLASFPDIELYKIWYKQKNNVELVTNSNSPITLDECHLWLGSTNNGYPVISQGHGKSKIRIHILSAWTTHHKFPSEKQVVSHLCHKKVINPNQVIIESIVSNNSRKKCLCSLVDLIGSVYQLCWHQPLCLRRDTVCELNSNLFVFNKIL